MRILEVTQMWPSPEHPDLGSFLVPLTRELRALGHNVEVASISRRGGPPTEYATLVRKARAAARSFQPLPLGARAHRSSSWRTARMSPTSVASPGSPPPLAGSSGAPRR